MTNYEKYEEQIKEIWESNSSIALDKGKPIRCRAMFCDDCDMNHGDCTLQIQQWLIAEYKEPPVDWGKVAVDTLILTKHYEKERWEKRYFAKYEDGKVYAWNDGRTSWSAESQDDICSWNYAKFWLGEE